MFRGQLSVSTSHVHSSLNLCSHFSYEIDDPRKFYLERERGAMTVIIFVIRVRTFVLRKKPVRKRCDEPKENSDWMVFYLYRY